MLWLRVEFETGLLGGGPEPYEVQALLASSHTLILQRHIDLQQTFGWGVAYRRITIGRFICMWCRKWRNSFPWPSAWRRCGCRRHILLCQKVIDNPSDTFYTNWNNCYETRHNFSSFTRRTGVGFMRHWGLNRWWNISRNSWRYILLCQKAIHYPSDTFYTNCNNSKLNQV